LVIGAAAERGAPGSGLSRRRNESRAVASAQHAGLVDEAAPRGAIYV
jgi:hypothetical protein